MTQRTAARSFHAMNLAIRKVALLAALGVVAIGCGDDTESIPAGADGKVVFEDTLDDNSNGWLDHPGAPFRNGEWEWNDMPAGGPELTPDALTGKSPEAVSVSASVTMREGSAFRAVACRYKPGADRFVHGYELGIDGRRGLIRKVQEGFPPKVLARSDLAVANGRKVRITGRCIPDGKPLNLTLVIDGKIVTQARDEDPFPRGDSGLRANPQPGNEGTADLSWDDFAVREARLR